MFASKEREGASSPGPGAYYSQSQMSKFYKQDYILAKILTVYVKKTTYKTFAQTAPPVLLEHVLRPHISTLGLVEHPTGIPTHQLWLRYNVPSRTPLPMPTLNPLPHKSQGRTAEQRQGPAWKRSEALDGHLYRRLAGEKPHDPPRIRERQV